MRKADVFFAFILACLTITPLGACGGRAKQPEGSAGPRDGAAGTPSASSEEVVLHAPDGFDVAGTYVAATGEGRKPACLLVHMLGNDRSTWREFQTKLAEAGINSLAIDMRGHGESTADGTLDYRHFDEEQWKAVENDFRAGLDYLRIRPDVDPAKLGIVGASIGANLAVIAAADEIVEGTANPLKFLVLLSPGVSYHGIAPLARGRDLGHMPVLILSATEDQQSYRGALSLSQAARGGELRSFEGGDHGTNLFETYPELMDEIIQWANNRLTGTGEQPEGDT